jgi:hypothetical protein
VCRTTVEKKQQEKGYTLVRACGRTAVSTARLKHRRQEKQLGTAAYSVRKQQAAKMRTGRCQHLFLRAEQAEQKSTRENFKLAARKERTATDKIHP